jgi:LPXTG-motif cell wall-anchored protein
MRVMGRATGLLGPSPKEVAVTELRTALRELAAGAEAPTVTDPGVLWTSGRRRVLSRRAVGAVVVLGLVAAVGTMAVVVPSRSVVMPAGAPHAPALPENIYTPSTRLAGTAQKGPLGQIAVLSGAQRGSSSGLFGISARTGEYRFLDLPDDAGAGAVVLSPDGNHLAYWFGPASGPHHANPNNPRADGPAIYDTRTGAVQKAAVPGKDGVRPGELSWYDDSTVLVSYRANGRGVGQIWRLGSEPRRASYSDLALRIGTLGGNYGRNRDGSVLLGTSPVTFERFRVGTDGELHRSTSGSGFKLPDPATPQSAAGDTAYSAVSVSGDLVLAVPFVAGAVGHPVMVGALPRLPETVTPIRVSRLDLVGHLQEALFLGWRDDHTALVVAHGQAATPELFEVDLRARTVQRLGVAEPQGWGQLVTVATDLVSQPMVRGLHPPVPPDLTAWYALGGLLLVMGALWVWRRRRA